MRSKYRFTLPLLVATVAALLPLVAFAANVDADAEHRAARLVTSARSFEWYPAEDAASVLSLQRPDGEVITQTFAAGRNPLLQLDGLADGLYSYELRFAQTEGGPRVQAGTFTVANGLVVSPNGVERVPARGLKVGTEEFFAEDVSATGGLCGGTDCTNAEVYGFASAKLKENNTRLKFEDTSAPGLFPGTDWQLSANDTTSGGANKFFIEDLTAATVPLLIEGATPTNTLYLDSTGRVGIRTSTPGRDLAIANTVSPTIRMEQSASPFQTWDIVATNNNWLVRDVNHEQNPFIIKTSAPNNTLVLDSTGRLGMGVAAPAFQIDHSSGARLDAGNWINASSRALKQDIHELDGAAALAALKALEPVTFAYTANPAETNVGFIAEDVPELVATSDHKGLSAMDVTAVLTKVIQQQQRTIEDLQTRMQELEKKE